MTEHWRELTPNRGGCCELLARLKEACDEQHEEIERLRGHIVVLEAEVIRTAGAMRKLHEEHIREEPFRVDYDQPPNTPR